MWDTRDPTKASVSLIHSPSDPCDDEDFVIDTIEIMISFSLNPKWPTADRWLKKLLARCKKLGQIVDNFEGIEKSPLPNKSGGDVLDYKQASKAQARNFLQLHHQRPFCLLALIA